MIPKDDELEELIKSLDSKKIGYKYFEGDVNTLKKSGFYYVDGSSTNIPVAQWSVYLIVIENGENYIYQEAEVVARNPLQQEKYKRQRFNGTWGDWILVNSKNITTGVEFKTGRIIDGKEEYGKRINCGKGPNSTTVSINIGLTVSNINLTRKIDVLMDGSTFVNFEAYSGFAGMYVSKNNNTLVLSTTTDASSYNIYATLYYTKNKKGG